MLVNNNVAGSLLGLLRGNFDQDKILIVTKNHYVEIFLLSRTLKIAAKTILYPHLKSQLDSYATGI